MASPSGSTAATVWTSCGWSDAAWPLFFCFAFGCGPSVTPDAEGGDSDSGTAATDFGGASGDSSGDSRSDTSDVSGPTNPSAPSGPTDPTGPAESSSTSGDTGGCELFTFTCPDGTCVPELGDEYICCGHGGACNEACVAQDARSGADTCADVSYSWTGEGCQPLCACAGDDCGALYESMGSCLDDHDPACGRIDLPRCPFESQLGPTLVSGSTPLGSTEYPFGAFGIVHGKGSSSIDIVIATDEVALGNYLWRLGDFSLPFETAPDVVQIFGGATSPGTYPVWVSIPGPKDRGAQGTLTINDVQVDGSSEEFRLLGELDVDEGDWSLHGQLSLLGCSKLEAHLP